MAGAGAAEGFAGQVGEGGIAVDGHDQVGLGEDAAQDVDDAVGAADGEAVGVGATDADGGSARSARASSSANAIGKLGRTPCSPAR
jgi:hypothetical protein